MASRFLDSEGYTGIGRVDRGSIPYKMAPIAPDDHVELDDCVGLVILHAGRDDLTIRWHDGTLTTTNLSHITANSVGAMIPCLPAFVMDTDTDFTDGDLAGLFLGGNTEIDNRSPVFRNSNAAPAEADRLERTIHRSQDSLEGILVADVIDPDYDTLTWSEEGAWDAKFSLITTGADAGRIDYVRSGNLARGTYTFTVGVLDAAGVNTMITQVFTIHSTI